MTLGEARTEMQARGFDYLSAARANQYLNQSYQELCEEAAWPFLEVSTSGTAPLAITDVRTILSVTDTTKGTVLTGMDRRNIMEGDPEMDDTGEPLYFFLDDTTLRVYPLNTTDTISVRYIEVPDELTADATEFDVPERYMDLVIDGAVIRAYKDADELDAAATLRQMWDQGVYRMRKTLMDRQWANTERILITDLEGWSV